MATVSVGNVRSEVATRHLAGWEVFSALVLVMAGVFNVVNGFTALQHSSYFTGQFVYSNLTFWGWMFLIWGALQVLAGGLVFGHSLSGNRLGVGLATVGAMIWFFAIFAAPWAAVVGVLVNCLVLYGLTVGLTDEAS